MFDLIYVAFFFIMIAEMVLFLFLNLPFPKSWKGSVIAGLAGNPTARTFFKIQLLLCLLVLVFYVDLSRSERMFLADKNRLQSKSNMGAGISDLYLQVVNHLSRTPSRKAVLPDNQNPTQQVREFRGGVYLPGQLSLLLAQTQTIPPRAEAPGPARRPVPRSCLRVIPRLIKMRFEGN